MWISRWNWNTSAISSADMSETSENFPKIPAMPVVNTGNSTDSIGKASHLTDREKFIEQAMTDHESALIGYASTILKDTDRARDVVQDTFLRLCNQDIAQVKDSLKSWLFTVCRNRALDILRKEKRNQPLDEMRWEKVVGPGLQPDEAVEYQEHLAQLTTYLARLTDNQREVITLKFQQGLSYQDIHKITGFTSGNIGFLIHTGLKRLRDILPDDLRI
jgi:RNA polymerase sigma factor (sigma-70 family)